MLRSLNKAKKLIRSFFSKTRCLFVCLFGSSKVRGKGKERSFVAFLFICLFVLLEMMMEWWHRFKGNEFRKTRRDETGQSPSILWLQRFGSSMLLNFLGNKQIRRMDDSSNEKSWNLLLIKKNIGSNLYGRVFNQYANMTFTLCR